MNNYRLLIQYDGSRYKGWQRLGQGESTVQAKIEQVLSRLVGEEVQIIGSSRTDAGVHALAQVANFRITQDLAPGKIKSYLNQHLPQDISVVEVATVPENFHARFQAKAKIYVYKIWNRDYSHPFMRKYSMQVTEPLDIAKMQQAAKVFLGEHDFTAFSNAKSKKKSMVRHIYSIEISEDDTGFLQIRIKGDGFLYNMVRKMVGVLILAGQGKMSADELKVILDSQERGQIGSMAEAGGLYLESIEF